MKAIRPCPECGATEFRVSRFRDFGEWLQSWFGVHWMRCKKCGARYSDHPWRWSTLWYAKCPRCYEMELRDWQEKYHLPPWRVRILTSFGWKQQRCEACRYNFVSLRPRWKKPKKNGSK